MSLSVLRVPPGSTVKVRLLASDALFVPVHWNGKRQCLCPGELCPICAGSHSRTTGFLPVQAWDGHDWSRPMLLGVSSSGMLRLFERSEFQSLPVEPGLVCLCSRRRANSPLRLEPDCMPDEMLFSLSRERQIAALAIIFGLPVPYQNEDIKEWELRVAPVAAKLLG